MKTKIMHIFVSYKQSYCFFMKEITLTQGKTVMVDDADYEWLNQYHWNLVKCCNHFYARRYEYKNGKMKAFSMHRMLLPDARMVDHKDNNGLNNQRENLRACNSSDNMKNRRKHRGTSQYMGVSRHLGYTWVAKINVNGKQKHLGCFSEEIEAARAYDRAA